MNTFFVTEINSKHMEEKNWLEQNQDNWRENILENTYSQKWWYFENQNQP